MSKFNFPRRPDLKRPTPFQDESGRNPFGDDAAEVLPSDEGTDDPYGARVDDVIQPYRPEEYETTFSHRGRLLVGLGIVACIASTLSIIAAPICVWFSNDTMEGLVQCVPGHLIALAAGMPAWIMGRSDLTAIKGGAMDDSGLKLTRRGLTLGWMTSLLSGVFVLSFIVLLMLTPLL